MTRIVAVAASTLALLLPARSFATTLNFPEYGSSQLVPLNHLQTSGLTISFLPGQGYYNGTIGTDGHSVFPQDLVLTGPTTGMPTLSFSDPSNTLDLDVVLLSLMPMVDPSLSIDGGPAYTISFSSGEHYNGATARQPGGLYPEEQFSYSGAATSNESLSFFYGRSASHNSVGTPGFNYLTFDRGDSTSTPEGRTLCMVGAGLIVLSMVIRQSTKRHRHPSEDRHGLRRRVRLVRQE